MKVIFAVWKDPQDLRYKIKIQCYVKSILQGDPSDGAPGLGWL